MYRNKKQESVLLTHNLKGISLYKVNVLLIIHFYIYIFCFTFKLVSYLQLLPSLYTSSIPTCVLSPPSVTICSNVS